MKKIASRIFAILMVCVFVNFVFMNTNFVHTHLLDDGSAISHSHPYLPSSHHSHTAGSMMSIAQFNAAATAMEGAVSYVPGYVENFTGTIDCDVAVHTVHIDVSSKALRGPPAIG